MKKILLLLLVASVFTMTFASVSFAAGYADKVLEKKYKSALSQGCADVNTKSPTTAALLGILPGGGSFYTGQIGIAIADVLLWPISSVWDIPLSYKKAKKINKEETIFYCEESGKKL